VSLSAFNKPSNEVGRNPGEQYPKDILGLHNCIFKPKKLKARKVLPLPASS